ncbi:hypothetical protein Q3G72_021739 [Acer saccharum]|nr:hypothetical protein Q3G72_021739 [Acer saccharum]
MYIEEVEDQIQDHSCSSGNSVVVSDAKRVLLGAGARALFYPTLLYNVVRNKIHSEFRWWDRVDELILLGAVPFPADVPRLRELGVSGVVTLNEPYETLVPASLYHVKNASLGKTTYVHCKAGRGRSTTIVLCYLQPLNSIRAIQGKMATDVVVQAPLDTPQAHYDVKLFNRWTFKDVQVLFYFVVINNKMDKEWVCLSRFSKEYEDGARLLRQPKWDHLKDLHKAIKLCEAALVATDPTVTSLGSNLHGLKVALGYCS